MAGLGATGEEKNGGGTKEGEAREEEGKKESTKDKEQKIPQAPVSKSKQAQLKVETTVHNLQATLEHLRGRWEIRKEEIEWGRYLSQGANAVVHICTIRGTTTCVGKKMKNNMKAGCQAYKDLMMEMDVLASIPHHPNVVQFLGACIEDIENPVMFEEYVNGPTLESIFGWSLDLLRALDFLHCRNPMIIHRDVKPANLILSKDLNIMKLMDFGMSKAVSLSERETSIHSGFTGTPLYMAPEVMLTTVGHYTEKADIYSASFVMWYIAVGKRPTSLSPDKLVGIFDRRGKWTSRRSK
ncbi:hypothetical protein GUITHDRAFT_111966 [Guillardia theta CCMP2712]|uniref:Protein kinase domain-containing protein n=1 Tax=Guillardia theta (strain CCMP2712) TaxID=905079 RepID=L1J1U8_GUITC|nr:hypothetical protein GUITHDRAFT_111966 [Guillardia theta CCMP2712]EKX42114.1 hypothetical protein GUITHDRAFT_111966 [Guillardia theta CCMP2712]|eukprot:XP_005829094.1 hypothetical protein GUITHDRAFT_111966 [Guillardia theta CCMP2712]